MKTLHTLKTKESLFTDFFVFDTETQGLRAKSDAFLFGVIYGHNFQKVIYSVEDFKKEFQDKRYKGKKVFAHNAEYDLNVIYDNIYFFDPKAIFNNRFICATNGNCLFADSMNIYPSSVKKIGEMMNLKKMKINNALITGRVKKISSQMITYCIRDCEIVWHALWSIFNEVGSIRITLASLALDYFRRKYQGFHIDYNEKLCNNFYDSYYGGRTEAFHIGKVNATVYDINSMYPDAMVRAIFPNPRTLKKRLFVTKPMFSYYLKNFEGCASLTITHKDNYFGFLPFRKNGKLLFPIGTFKGVWNFNEIRFALSKNIINIKKIHYIVYGDKMISPFINYVNDLYEKKKNGTNQLYKEIYKLLLTNLYGKFAQRINSQFIYINNYEKQIKLVEYYERKKQLIRIIPFSFLREDCFIEVKAKKGFLYNSIPLFSSYITSYARIKLLSELLKYKDYKPVYCDTDSIFFNIDPKIKESDQLGQWKKENKQVLEIRGLKNYLYIRNEKITDVIKGVPKNAEKYGDIYKYNTLVKTREGLRRNIETGVLMERVKKITGIYNKRNVLQGGFTTPLKIGTVNGKINELII